MKRLSLDEQLRPAPASVRRAILEARDDLEPGAAAVVGRLFAIAGQRREPQDMPGPQSFRAAATSEPILRLLLRALASYAPEVCTAGALDLKAEWVARRPKTAEAEGSVAEARSPRSRPSWPAGWEVLRPALEAAPIAESSKARYRASISRCAQIVAAGGAGEELTFLTAFLIAEALAATGKVKLVTAAGYLDGLVALGRHGGAPADGLNGVRYMRDHLRGQASGADKEKFGRIAGIMQRGGFSYVAQRVSEMRAEAAGLPDHAARAVLLRQSAALCALHMNKPARTGDVSRWRIGEELVRQVDGSWLLEWDQEKNDRSTGAGQLWPEVGEVLDEHLLGGRPSRFVHLRYREVVGANWLTLNTCAPGRQWPSATIKAAVGIPSHDLRTLAADYLRRHDPETAARIISTHLGHGTAEAGEDYRAEAEGEAAARSWQVMREAIAAR